MPKIRNVWEKEYTAVLKDKLPDTWYPVMQGRDWRSYEISVCNTRSPHGFISYGWDGPDKIIVGTANRYDAPTKKQEAAGRMVYEAAIRNAEAVAEMLNKMLK